MIALSFVSGEQKKALLLTNAKGTLIRISSWFFLLGVAMTAADIHLVWQWATLQRVALGVPLGIVAAVLASFIESGTLLGTTLLKQAIKNRNNALTTLGKVSARLDENEVKVRKRLADAYLAQPITITLMCVMFSITGAELFWQRVLETQTNWWMHVIGFIMGASCSLLLIVFEMQTEKIERIVDGVLSASALIEKSRVMSIKATVFDNLHRDSQRALKLPHIRKGMEQIAERSIYGISSEALEQVGVRVSEEQLREEIAERNVEKQRAEAYLETKDEQLLVEAPKTKDDGKRVTPGMRRFNELKKQHGLSEMKNNPAKFAELNGVTVKTFERYLVA